MHINWRLVKSAVLCVLFVSIDVNLALSYTDACINCKRRYCCRNKFFYTKAICLFSQKIFMYWKTLRSSQIAEVYFVWDFFV